MIGLEWEVRRHTVGLQIAFTPSMHWCLSKKSGFAGFLTTHEAGSVQDQMASHWSRCFTIEIASRNGLLKVECHGGKPKL